MKKLTRFVLVSDTHGDEIDRKAERMFFEFVRDYKPTIRVHMGDAFDFRCFRRKASDEERRGALLDDINAGIAFMDEYKPTHWLRGNHDERLWDAIRSDDKRISDLCFPVRRDIEKSVGQAVTLPYCKRQGVMKLADYHLLHGYHAGVNACRAAGLIWGNVVMGHVHSFDSASIPGPDKRTARSIGCLAKLDLDYNRATPATLRQANGWAYGVIKDGKATIYDAEIRGGQVIIASDLRVY